VGVLGGVGGCGAGFGFQKGQRRSSSSRKRRLVEQICSAASWWTTVQVQSTDVPLRRRGPCANPRQTGTRRPEGAGRDRRDVVMAAVAAASAGGPGGRPGDPCHPCMFRVEVEVQRRRGIGRGRGAGRVMGGRRLPVLLLRYTTTNAPGHPRAVPTSTLEHPRCLPSSGLILRRAVSRPESGVRSPARRFAQTSG